MSDLSEDRREYWKDCEEIAKECRKECGADTDAQSDWLHESIDGSQWVIYHYRALLVRIFSNNADAAEDEGLLDLASCSSLDNALSIAAYGAMLADVCELLDALPEEESEKVTTTEAAE